MTTTLTDSQKQTIRIALAKWMGWTDIHPSIITGLMGRNPEKSMKEWGVPNPPASLDACHEVELKLTDEQHKAFRIEMWKLSGASFSIGYEDEPSAVRRAFVSASAEHRSLALYLSLNLGELGD